MEISRIIGNKSYDIELSDEEMFLAYCEKKAEFDSIKIDSYLKSCKQIGIYPAELLRSERFAAKVKMQLEKLEKNYEENISKAADAAIEYEIKAETLEDLVIANIADIIVNKLDQMDLTLNKNASQLSALLKKEPNIIIISLEKGRSIEALSPMQKGTLTNLISLVNKYISSFPKSGTDKKIAFKDKNTGQIKYAYAIRSTQNKVYVQFDKNGKEYGYSRENIEVCTDPQNFGNIVKKGAENSKLSKHSVSQTKSLSFITYEYQTKCYACGRKTGILTYIVFSDGTNESAVFPWDKKRALKRQDIMAHMQDPSCEYYGIYVIGDIAKLDKLLMERYPGRISIQYSGVVNKSYPMNLCEHCGAKQGKNYVYRYVNNKIKNMESIDIVE